MIIRQAEIRSFGGDPLYSKIIFWLQSQDSDSCRFQEVALGNIKNGHL